MLDPKMTSEDAINAYIAKLSNKIGIGKNVILCSEDIRELIFDTRDELLSVEVPKELKSLICDFEEKFEAAHNAREKVINYLQEKYDFDNFQNGEYIEDENFWVYGLNHEHIQTLLNEQAERSNA